MAIASIAHWVHASWGLLKAIVASRRRALRLTNRLIGIHCYSVSGLENDNFLCIWLVLVVSWERR
jgi:hypothetical protein